MDATGAGYLHLNCEGRWLDFSLVGLELGADGTLALQSLPALLGSLPPELASLGAPDGPSGVAVARDGGVFYTVPPTDALMLVDACDGSHRPVRCVSRSGSAPGELRTPRGLAFHRERNSLLVADTGNNRIQVLALPDLQVAEIWTPGAQPVSVACDGDGDGYVYVVAAGQVEKLDALGRALPEFWRNASADGRFDAVEVAVTQTSDDHTWVVVLDAAGEVRVFDGDGRQEQRWATGAQLPMGLASGNGAIYLGDDGPRVVLVFGIDGTPRGRASGYAGPVGAATLDRREGLLVHAGGEPPPVRLSLTGAYGRRGIAWGGPFRSPAEVSFPRHLLRATVALPPVGVQFQLYVCEQPAGGTAPPVDPGAPDPFSDEGWRRVPVAAQATETLVAGQPLDEVWVGMALAGEGAATPVVSQARIDFAHETLLQYLPAVYQRDAASADLLARWLTIFESEFDHVEEAIDGLARLFDSSAAAPDWLGWLAGWLALELPEGWDTARRRHAIAEAFARDAWRGTADGLRNALRERTGVEAEIEEPITETSWWALPDDDGAADATSLSVLGASTVLTVGEPDGAVVGTTAVLDASFLAAQDRYATALFSDVAHQFSVRLYRGRSFSGDAVAAVRKLLDEERPAHTLYHLCVVEPRMRVGVQARLGIDAIVGGAGAATLLEDAGATALRLDGPSASRLGQSTQVGRTHLTNG